MRLAETEKLNAVRGSEGSGSTMAADALKVKREGFILLSLVPHSLDTWILLCSVSPLKWERRQTGKIFLNVSASLPRLHYSKVKSYPEKNPQVLSN